MTKNVCCVVLSWQRNIGVLKALYERAKQAPTARMLTIGDIRVGLASAEPANIDTAHWLCLFLQQIPLHTAAVGCTILKEADAIQALFVQLKLWPTVRHVVLAACVALNNIALHATPAVKATMRKIPKCRVLLQAVNESALDVHDGRHFAADVLKKLGML